MEIEELLNLCIQASFGTRVRSVLWVRKVDPELCPFVFGTRNI
jgi:hypothetical protein